jgi:hypothetical protein
MSNLKELEKQLAVIQEIFDEYDFLRAHGANSVDLRSYLEKSSKIEQALKSTLFDLRFNRKRLVEQVENKYGKRGK